MNVIDYIKWRGDLSFKVDRFNVVDNLLLTYCAYVDVDEVMTNEDASMSVKQLSDAFFKIHPLKDIKKDKSLIAQAPLTLYWMARSKRYKDVIVHHYADIIREENCVQFAAQCFDLDDDTTFISFRGTDDTIVGWREDFQISYKITNAQKLSVDYLNRVIQPGKKYRIGGHSKGGNLALYGAIEVADKYADQILNVFSNDGPGLAKEMFNQEKFALIKHKYIKIVPEQSVIGQLFNYDNDQLVVKSSSFFVGQHDGLSWQVEGPKFVYEKNINELVANFNEAVAEFLNEATFEEREKLTNGLFDALDEAGLKNVSDIITKGLPMIVSVLKSMGEIDKGVMKIASKLPAILGQQAANDIKELAKKGSNNIKTYASNKVGELKVDIKKEISSISNKIKEGLS